MLMFEPQKREFNMIEPTTHTHHTHTHTYIYIYVGACNQSTWWCFMGYINIHYKERYNHIYIYIYIYCFTCLHQEKCVLYLLNSYKYNHPQPQINYPHFAWPVWRIVFQVGIIYNYFKANQLIRDPSYDSYETCQEFKGRGLQRLEEKLLSCSCMYTCIYIYA